MSVEHFDVVIIGAGLSGIGAACHLQTQCPDRSYVILEGREASGGTWDLFRYPGVRSDSDMYTLGYVFRPWREAKAIADGPSILNYIRETARAYGVDRQVRYRHKVLRAAWSSANAAWTVEAEVEGRAVAFTCNFLLTCTGYYDYAGGYTPEIAGMERFGGRIVHPQAWPEGLDYAGRQVVVIGSGATAVTVVPAMAETAAHVVMLQRSPTYVVSRPSEDAFANKLRERLPARLAYHIVRWRNVMLTMVFFNLARRRPGRVKARLIGWVRDHLGPDYDVETHFTPRYNPWDQRLCLVPDGDLFRAIRSGKASVATDTIEGFTEDGIRLSSGRDLKADVVVMATGLQMQLLGGVQVSVDGAPVDLSRRLNYKGTMCEGVPNLASIFGYTNASWTLKGDLTAGYVCRLLNYMKRRGYDVCTPRERDPDIAEQPIIDFSSSYVRRAVDRFPKQGSRAPWRLRQNYLLDLLGLKFGRVVDGVMQFSRKGA
ncbi:MAG: NAD(P)/FAD-dependent oxidoreductase [Caulobacteraceae bacterium]